MRRDGAPCDNAYCEGFIKTLEQEKICCRDYTDGADLDAHIGAFIEDYYNSLHTSLSYRTSEDV